MLKLKFRDALVHQTKNSYASDSHSLPANSIDCTDGINPFGCPSEVNAVLKDKIIKIAEYPHNQDVYVSIINYWKDSIELNKDNIILTDGSISALYIINNIFASRGAKVLGISPQFSEYISNALLLGMDYLSVEMDATNGYKLPIDELLDRITSDLSLIYLDNPNNPTGQVISTPDLERIVTKASECNVCVIIDEAYGDFIPTNESATILLKKFNNLIVVRTMSKGFAMAGVRAGYILSNKSLIDMLLQVTNPYAVSEIGRHLMVAALDKGIDTDTQWKYFADAKAKIRSTIGRNLKMSTTDDRVPIFMLYVDNPDTNLYELLAGSGIIAVQGSSCGTKDDSSVRIRLPEPKYFGDFMNAIISCENKKVKSA